MTRPADSHQVGGDHYAKLKVQPAHLIASYDLHGFEASIVKYFTRWRDKGGIEDLRKIVHYCDWLLENANRFLLLRFDDRERKRMIPRAPLTVTAYAYCRENELPDVESRGIRAIVRWHETLKTEAISSAKISALELIHSETDRESA